ncbi:MULTISPECIES: HYR domain-containing protein [unclassified Corallococcus]|uniref:HYR domain-containing protein n=1 Tax=unclassified Corallococcus TaxID=2685029 RepID=UPI001A903E40|nr:MULTISPECIES: HYR domain-containing protein [unclassified Corallococcus]MBN9682918.1 HYR domain-containing protein [Corallococcus sp. NCSPR001]WAS85547.1 HYR domain-containing protein [Corallococcus sp. NCRR]
MGMVGGRAWLSALSLVMSAAPVFAQGSSVQMDPMTVRRVMDVTVEPRLEHDFAGTGSRPTAELNGRLYFLATLSGTSLQELWVTDGTPEGTRSVQQELLPAGTSIDRGSLRATPRRLFFTAVSEGSGRELWTSDGTREGTHVTRELAPGMGHGVGNAAPTFVFGDTLLFAPTHSAQTEFDLWRTDGTEAGTVPLKDIYPGFATANVHGFTRVGDTVYFAAENERGFELWRTDGTEAGTTLVRDIKTGVGDSYPEQLTDVAGTLYFTAVDDTGDRAVWKSDGTAEGTVRVKGFNTVVTGRMPTLLTAVNGTLVFLVRSAEESSQLWRTDGTDAGTQLLAHLPSAMINASTSFVPSGDRAYLVAQGATLGDSMWVTDGTAAGTLRLPSPAASARESVRGVTPWEDGLAFIVTTQAGASELWRTDGTNAGTSRLTRLPSGTDFALPTGLVPFQGALLTTAGDPWTPHALWRMERDEAAPTFLCPATQDMPSNRPEGTDLIHYRPELRTGAEQAWIRTPFIDGQLLALNQPIAITYQAGDAQGRLTYCTTVLTSRDLTAPAINACPTSLTLNAQSPRGTTFYYPHLGIGDETSRDVIITYSPTNGSVLPLGTTQMNVTARDASGNESTCAFAVTVRDNQAPGQACKVNEVRVEAEGPDGAHAFWPDLTPTDSLSSKVTVTGTHASGDLFPLGLTRVQVVSTDEAGNSSTCEIQVRVRDSRPPVLTCPEDQTLTTAVMSGTRAEYPAATAKDSVSEVELLYSPVVGTPLAPGLHAVQVTAIDKAGNAALCDFHLTVQYDPTSDMRQGMGCSVGSGPESAVGWAALVALAWTLSRRLKDGKPRA